ncbi:MAG: tRNA dihydrouridine synthase DusB [Bacteroidales bacterium]|nr:tRNA dihydrouridine synthase DusB [Bacteroidales bacterium]
MILITIGNTTLPLPSLILAPMENITDSPFRSVCREFGADLVVSEFISSEGLIRDAVKSRIKLTFEESERPVSIQIFGHDVDSMRKAAELAEEAKPDMIDLNFGCPVRKVVRKGAGAALLKDIPRMLEIAAAVVNVSRLPVTVKTRLGWDATDQPIVTLAEQLQDLGIAAIAIHGRTAVQQYGGQADWRLIGEVKQNPRMKIPVFGNGDITNAITAKERLDQTSVDGLMIGRAATGNPWIFREIRSYLQTGMIPAQPDIQERVAILREHFRKSVAYKGERLTLLEFRKFYSGYFKGIPDMRPFRRMLVTATKVFEIDKILQEIEHSYP